MEMTVRTLTVSINPDRLMQELGALPVKHLELFGYDRETDRKWILRKGPNAYDKTLKRELTAQPGEIHIITSRILTAQEGIDMDAILAAHNHTVLSDPQSQYDADDAIIASLKATLVAGQELTMTQLTNFVKVMFNREM